MTLLNYIKKENEKKRQWMRDNPGNWAGMMIEDEKHWNEYGVYTPEELEIYFAKAAIWDCFKDKHGVRPRHMNLDGKTLDELLLILKEI